MTPPTNKRAQSCPSSHTQPMTELYSSSDGIQVSALGTTWLYLSRLSVTLLAISQGHYRERKIELIFAKQKNFLVDIHHTNISHYHYQAIYYITVRDTYEK